MKPHVEIQQHRTSKSRAMRPYLCHKVWRSWRRATHCSTCWTCWCSLEGTTPMTRPQWRQDTLTPLSPTINWQPPQLSGVNTNTIIVFVPPCDASLETIMNLWFLMVCLFHDNAIVRSAQNKFAMGDDRSISVNLARDQVEDCHMLHILDLTTIPLHCP